ncbi:MAG: FAD/NAD(P)-binding protein [Neisseriaceae bacterium]
MNSSKIYDLAIVGFGPRGLSVLHRVVEELLLDPWGAQKRRFLICCFDNFSLGAGKIWNPKKNPHLLMNTVASQVTIFMDETIDNVKNIAKRKGPSLYEWTKLKAAEEYLQESGYTQLIEIAKQLDKDDYAPRILYGLYLKWVLAKLLVEAKAFVEIDLFTVEVVKLVKEDNIFSLSDAVGAEYRCFKLVLSTGHVDHRVDNAEKKLIAYAKKNQLTYVRPCDAAYADLSNILPQSTVVIRGLGLNFFDYIILLTVGRGGTFQRTSSGSMVYMKSGQEPLILAGSLRGVPHQARGKNEKGVSRRHIPVFLTREKILELQAISKDSGGLNFMVDVWPLIMMEVEYVYVSTLLKKHGIALTDEHCQEIVHALKISRTKCYNYVRELLGFDYDFDLHHLLTPTATADFSSVKAFNHWMLQYLSEDIEAALSGNVSNPLKAALDALRDLRNEIRQLIDFGVVSIASVKNHVEKFYNRHNNFLSIGPPVERILQLKALIEAGVVINLGPEMFVEKYAGKFVAFSPFIRDSYFYAESFIEARISPINVHLVDSKLISSLLTQNIASSYKRLDTNAEEGEVCLGAIETLPSHTNECLGNMGGLFVFGIPTEGYRWATSAGIRPDVGSVILTESSEMAKKIVHDFLSGEENTG